MDAAINTKGIETRTKQVPRQTQGEGIKQGGKNNYSVRKDEDTCLDGRTDRHTDRQMNRQTDRQTDGTMDGQTDRPTGI